MALGKCEICSVEQAKYKCPKCSRPYCSLNCFKSTIHQAMDSTTAPAEEPDAQSPILDVHEVHEVHEDSKFNKIFEDEKIEYLLSFKALQVHLSDVYDILTDMTSPPDKRTDAANAKLNRLRTAGQEENELVEEFCERVLELLDD